MQTTFSIDFVLIYVHNNKLSWVFSVLLQMYIQHTNNILPHLLCRSCAIEMMS